MDRSQQRTIDRLIETGRFRSQKKQDIWVITEALPGLRRGYFLDLAAADGITHSNTIALERFFGWTGLCIEPNPTFYEQLVAERTCATDSTVVSNKVETVSFRLDNGQLGGIVADDTDNSERKRGDELNSAELVTLDACPIGDILAKHNAPPVIDYFSLDVEGSEERIITTLDFDRYQFRCLTIERPTPVVNEVLRDHGYCFVRNQRFDSFYASRDVVESSRLACEPFEQIPAKDW